VLGVAKLLAPGTVVDVHAGASREWESQTFVTDVNPAYTEEWGFTVSQPLLRGFGVRVNTAGIATARNERRIAQTQLRSAAITTVADVTKAVWALGYAIRDRALVQRSLDRALNLQKDIQARVDAKVLGERDPAVAQAKAEVAVRQEEIVEAEQAIRDVEDAIKVITDLAADPAVWGLALVPTTELPSTVPPLDAGKAVETAIAKRPDYQQAQVAIDSQEILLYVRRNELKPKLDLTAGYGYSGLGNAWNSADHHLGSMDFYQWQIGLTLEYPLGNRAARSRFRRAKLERDQARIGLKALERQINLEVRNAVRAVGTSVERMRAADASIAAEQERLRAEEIRYKEARVGTIQDVLDAQAALAEAERRALAALLDLNNALVDVRRLQGTILEDSDVTWQEE
jgi:outer membrane protein TolC